MSLTGATGMNLDRQLNSIRTAPTTGFPREGPWEHISVTAPGNPTTKYNKLKFVRGEGQLSTQMPRTQAAMRLGGGRSEGTVPAQDTRDKFQAPESL